jgi:hypothetical protein
MGILSSTDNEHRLRKDIIVMQELHRGVRVSGADIFIVFLELFR